MTKSKVRKAAEYSSTLDIETQKLLEDVRKKNSKALSWFVACWAILLVPVVFGLYYQNRIATENKAHIDCIIKLSETVPKQGQAKYIDFVNNRCNIRFTK